MVAEDEKGGESSLVYAVNLSPSESRVDAFDSQILADFGITMQREIGAAGPKSETAEGEKEDYRLELQEQEGRQKAWKWIVLAMLLVLWLESWVAGRVGGVKSEEIRI